MIRHSENGEIDRLRDRPGITVQSIPGFRPLRQGLFCGNDVSKKLPVNFQVDVGSNDKCGGMLILAGARGLKRAGCA